MSGVLHGLDELCDQWLGLDESWPGTKPPRYPNKATLQRLCENGWGDLCGQQLMWNLYGQIALNWSGRPCSGRENWRFKKQLKLTERNPSPEVTLERTIARITDDNWVNQVPIASGVDGTGRKHNIDLIHRSDAVFTFIELKVESNHPLFAAFEIVKYGMVYVFSRIHAEQLDYQVNKLDLLQAGEVRLQVLAPGAFYAIESMEWLRSLEQCLNTGLQQFARKELRIPMGFEFSIFPKTFKWDPANHNNVDVQRDLLHVLEDRVSLDGQKMM